jgi:phosphoglucosamine mutase
MSRLRTKQLVGDVVGTKMTNLGVEHALARQNIGLVRTDVGDRYIMEKLKAESWIIGGESSGHIICRDRTTTGDGIVAALQVLAEMHFSQLTLEQLLDDVVLYPQQLINIRLAKSVDVINHPDMVSAVLKSEQALAGNGRVLLRPSGTEPLIRVMVEGKNADDVKQHAGSLAQKVEDIIAQA